MLQLQAEKIDIVRVSIILAKYNIKASITDSAITLDGDISNELLTNLCKEIDIVTVKNFRDETETLSEKKESKSTVSKDIPRSYDLLYSTVKRGEVYLCDFGTPYGSELGFIRPVTILQNDIGNKYSPNTIVIPCTSSRTKKDLPTHIVTNFSNNNATVEINRHLLYGHNVILVEQIKCVDKTRLRKYIGKLTPDFMKIIDNKIEITLDLEKNANTPIVKTKYVVERKGLNMTQIQLLSMVNINELLNISKSSSTDEFKVNKILNLFGFDTSKNGVQYLNRSIIISLRDTHFNLETLSKSISDESGLDKAEIKRLIVARVKETLGFRKAHTIDFIRTVNSFLTKQEV